jgi:hypothetical protein
MAFITLLALRSTESLVGHSSGFGGLLHCSGLCIRGQICTILAFVAFLFCMALTREIRDKA